MPPLAPARDESPGSTKVPMVDGRVARTPTRLNPPDGVTVLTIYLVLLLGIPSSLGIGPLGGAGSPASLFGLGMLVWWLWDHLHRPRATPRLQIVRLAMLVFCACVLASYAAAALTSLPQADVNGADRGLLRVASFAGVLLVAHDGIATRARFIVMLRRVVIIATLYALLGLVQFFSGHVIIDLVQIPGLTADDDAALIGRAGFARAQATATHALEYSSVLAVAVPLAVTFALYDRPKGALARWLPVVVLSMAAVLSVSRSGLVGLAIGILVLVPTWRPMVRRISVLAAVAGLAVIYVLIPGMMGTIIGMFSGAAEDTSIASRTSGYTIVGQLFALHPVVGRGLGTLLPSYRILDNQYLVLLVDVGLLGLMAFALILIAAVVVVRWRRRVIDELSSALGNALSAAVVAAGVLMAFFDSFSFQQASAMLIMTAGLCGAFRNVCTDTAGSPRRGEDRDHGASTPRGLASAVRRRWYVVAVVLVGAVPFVLTAHRATGVYTSQVDVTILAPPGAAAGNPLWTGSDGLVKYAAMVQRMVSSSEGRSQIETVSAPLYGTGVQHAARVYLPNSGGQWQVALRQAVVRVEIVGSSVDEVRSEQRRIVQRIQSAASVPQQQMGVHASAYITTDLSPRAPTVVHVPIRAVRAEVAVLVLAAALALAAAVVSDRVLADRVGRQRHPVRDAQGDEAP